MKSKLHRTVNEFLVVVLMVVTIGGVLMGANAFGERRAATAPNRGRTVSLSGGVLLPMTSPSSLTIGNTSTGGALTIDTESILLSGTTSRDTGEGHQFERDAIRATVEVMNYMQYRAVDRYEYNIRQHELDETIAKLATRDEVDKQHENLVMGLVLGVMAGALLLGLTLLLLKKYQIWLWEKKQVSADMGPYRTGR